MQNWSPDGVKQERSNWRDQALSERHRLWGFDCPATDIDFLMVEYNLGEPVGLVDFKHYLSKEQTPNLNHPNYVALCRLADGYKNGPLPFLIVFYWPENWSFRVVPVNERAKDQFNENEMLSEREFVYRLYDIRSRKLTEHLEKSLNRTMPPMAAQQDETASWPEWLRDEQPISPIDNKPLFQTRGRA